MCEACTATNGLCPSCRALGFGDFALSRSAGPIAVLRHAARTLGADAGVFWVMGMPGYVVLGLMYNVARQVLELRGFTPAALIGVVALPLVGVALLAARISVALESLRAGSPSAEGVYAGVKRTLPVLCIAAAIGIVVVLLGVVSVGGTAMALLAVGHGEVADNLTFEVISVVGWVVLVLSSAYLLVPLSLALVPAADGIALGPAVRLGFAAARGRRWQVLAVQLVAWLLLVPAGFTFCIGVPFALAFMDLSLTSAYLAYAPRGSGSAGVVSGA